MRKRKYSISLSPNYQNIVNEMKFATLNKNKDVLSPRKLYYVEYNIDLSILGMLSSHLLRNRHKMQICQNMSQLVNLEQISPIVDQFLNGKRNVQREINETISRIRQT